MKIVFKQLADSFILTKYKQERSVLFLTKLDDNKELLIQ